MKSNYSINLTYKFHALQNLQIRFSRENLNLDWDLNQASDLEIRGSNTGPGSNFSLENLIHETSESHIDDTMYAQEHRASFHSQATRNVVTTALPFKTGDSRARVNRAKGLELV